MFGFFRKRSENSKNSKSRKSQRKTGKRFGGFEPLEDRRVLSAFSVVNLNDSGTGSLRAAIQSANSSVGADTINFAVAGTIKLTSGSLPSITGPVDIDGSTAPGFASQPVVGVDFNRAGGLIFNQGSDGSELRSLALFNSGSNAVTLIDADDITIAGNYVGVNLAQQPVANAGNGIAAYDSDNTTIGGTEIVSGYLVVDRNVISANKANGVLLVNVNDSTVVGNYIGVDVTGTLDQGNLTNGILLTAGSNNVIGGAIVNVISGNESNGVLLNGATEENTVAQNLIGTNWSGGSAIGNRLDGIKLEGAEDNVIGNTDAVSSITYYNTDQVPVTVSGWQGLRGGDTAGEYLITGTSDADALLFDGTIEGVGTAYTFQYPNAYNTSAYGPDNLGGGQVRVVGSYKNPDYATAPVEVNGFLYEGPLSDPWVLGPSQLPTD